MSRHTGRAKPGIVSVVLALLLAGCSLSANPPATTGPVASSQPPALSGDLISQGKTATASNSMLGGSPDNAVDSDTNTTWKSGESPEQWVQIDLGAPTAVTGVRLVTYQPLDGETIHQIWAGSSEGDLKLVRLLTGTTADNQELIFSPDIPLSNVRYVRIVTVKSPVLVAWREIQVYGTPVIITSVPTVPPVADTIYYNGTILTMETDHPTAEAIAVQGDRILAVGSQADVFAYQGSTTKMVDLGGLTLTPGFIDSHEHRIGDRWQYGNPPVSQVFYEILKEGWTSIHEMWVDNTRLTELVGWDSQSQVPVRVSMYLKMNSEAAIDNWWQAYQPLHQYSPYLQIAGLKITLDREWGQAIFIDQANLNTMVLDAHNRGWQVATHAFSPTANALILNAYGNALNRGPNEPYRFRLEHTGVMTDAEVQQMASEGIIGSVQLVSTGAWPDDPSFKTYIPQNEWELSGRWRDMINAGVFLIGNTDAPWCCTDWRNNFQSPAHPPTVIDAIYQGITRTTFTNRPPEAWQTAQVVTVQEALEMMTIRSAYAAHQENVTGSLKAGKYADLTVLSGNPLTTPISQIPTLKVVMTAVGGKVEYCVAGYQAVCTATSAP